MSNITWNNAEALIENTKEVMGKEMFSSYQSMITHQNCLVTWLGIQVDRLAAEFETKEARMAAKATHTLWGDLYQIAETDEEEARQKVIAEFCGAFMEESESPWLTLTFTVAITRYALKGAVHFASQAAEKGNSNALETLAHFKSNLADFEDIAQTLGQIADA